MSDQAAPRKTPPLFTEPSERRRHIMDLSLPIIGGMLSQNLVNVVDTAMVGSLGDAALAGVGVGSFANFTATAFIMGLSAGVQTLAARRVGEGRLSETAVALNGGILLATGLAIPLSILLILTAPWYFPFLNGDPKVIAEGVPYLQIRLVAMMGIGINFAFRGYWNGINRSGLYLQTILIMHAANIFLNWVFIYGNLGSPAMGTFGAGLATMISMYVGTIMYFVLGFRHARPAGFLRGLPDKASFQTSLRLSIPAGLQQFFFAAGMMALFWIIGKIGTRELAASNVLITLLLVASLPSLGFGLTATSLVSQALGRKDPQDAMRWGWEVTWIGTFTLAVISLPGLFFPHFVLSFFLKNPETLALAVIPLQLLAATMALEGVGRVLMQALLGAGDSKRIMVISLVLQWIIFLPSVYFLGAVAGFGMIGIWSAMVFYRLTQAGIFAYLWKQGEWQKIKLA